MEPTPPLHSKCSDRRQLPRQDACPSLLNTALSFILISMAATPVIRLTLSPAVSSLLADLQDLCVQRHIAAFVVGGLVRDLVMGRGKADIDIAVAGDALAIGKEIAGCLNSNCIVLDSENNVVRLLPKKEGASSGDWQIDLAALQGNLPEDLGRRDFTIDAMAVDLCRLGRTRRNALEATVIDPFNGLGDIQKKLIRAVNPSVFRQDAIRPLRGVRLGAELGFAIEPQTEALIQRDGDLIKNVASERVREELLRLFALPGTDETVVYMDKLGLLTAIIPELAATRDVEQPKEHIWNVFHHSARSISATDFILRKGNWEYAPASVLESVPWDETLEKYFEERISPLSSRRILTKLAALLHDIAKPQTRIVNEYGRIRFYGHPQEGAPVAATILERLRCSTREIKFVETVVRYHLRPVQMTEERELPTKRAVYRYFRDMGEAAIATLYFSLADHLATRGPNLEKENWDWHVSVVARLIAEHEKAPQPTASPRLLDGHDLQREFKLLPGHRLGELLEELREAQAAGEITTRQEALDYVKKLLKEDEKASPQPDSD